MKKLLSFLVFTMLFACSSDSSEEDMPDFDATKLQKVVFGDGEVWNFNENGLLTETIKGNTRQVFTYSDEGRLVIFEVFIDGVLTRDDWFYSIPGAQAPVWWETNPPASTTEAIGNDTKYTFYYQITDPFVEPMKAEITINPDGEIVRREVFFVELAENPNPDFDRLPVIAFHENGNMVRSAFNDFATEQDYIFDQNPNPLRDAILPAARAFAFIEANSLEDAADLTLWNSPTSVNNVTQLSFEAGNPESYSYTYTYNSNNLPVIKTAQAFSSGIPQGSPYEFAHYYYQGDVIP